MSTVNLCPRAFGTVLCLKFSVLAPRALLPFETMGKGAVMADFDAVGHGSGRDAVSGPVAATFAAIFHVHLLTTLVSTMINSCSASCATTTTADRAISTDGRMKVCPH
jgi:hypothetical protein